MLEKDSLLHNRSLYITLESTSYTLEYEYMCTFLAQLLYSPIRKHSQVSMDDCEAKLMRL